MKFLKDLKRTNATPKTIRRVKVLRGTFNEGGVIYEKDDVFLTRMNIVNQNVPGLIPRLLVIDEDVKRESMTKEEAQQFFPEEVTEKATPKK